MSDASSGTTRDLSATVFTLGALGEIGIGVLLLAFPDIGALLIATQLDPAGLLLARMLGAAVLGLGVTWWLSRLDAAGLSRCAAGFLVYNFGISALFFFAAIAATRPTLPALVCAAHLVLGAAFAVAALARAKGRVAR